MAKVMISLPDDLLARIDREAGRRGETRSAFLQEAARNRLGWPEPAVLDAALALGRAAAAGLRPADSTQAVRHDRDERDARDRRR